MAGNKSLGAAKEAKNDEFYTQYSDIEAEMNAYVEFNPDVFRDKTVLLPCDDPEWSNFTKYFASNFSRFGLRKLISTSYARSSSNKQATLFETESPLYDAQKHDTHGKLFTLTHDTNGSGQIDTDDIEFSGYLEGDGDFRSAEVTALRDEADIIITNPPFSLFHDFMSWIADGRKQFAIIGNLNALKYREVFPELLSGDVWLGTTGPKEFVVSSAIQGRDNVVNDGTKMLAKFGNVRWYTNIDHGLRHTPIILDTRAHNIKFNNKLKKRLASKYETTDYPRFSNYDALEVPFVECIPSDYDGVMGVPISFLEKLNPDQFTLLGMSGILEWATTDCSFFLPPSPEVVAMCKQKKQDLESSKSVCKRRERTPAHPCLRPVVHSSQERGIRQMKTTLHTDWTVGDICEGFLFD